MGYTKNRNFYKVPNLHIFAPGARISKFLRPAQRYDVFFMKFKKTSKTAVVLIAVVKGR